MGCLNCCRLSHVTCMLFTTLSVKVYGQEVEQAIGIVHVFKNSPCKGEHIKKVETSFEFYEELSIQHVQSRWLQHLLTLESIDKNRHFTGKLSEDKDRNYCYHLKILETNPRHRICRMPKSSSFQVQINFLLSLDALCGWFLELCQIEDLLVHIRHSVRNDGSFKMFHAEILEKNSSGRIQLKEWNIADSKVILDKKRYSKAGGTIQEHFIKL